MSTLTKCCNCDECVPVRPEWTLLPTGTTTATATEFGLVTLNAAGEAAVTSSNDKPMIVADVLLRFGKILSAYWSRPVATPATVDVSLWCDANGSSAAATVRLRLEPGTPFTGRRSYAAGVSATLPISHVVTYATLELDDLSTLQDVAYKSVNVWVELLTGDAVTQSFLALTCATADDWSRGVPEGVGLQVFAAYEDGQLDVCVRLINSLSVNVFGTWDSPANLPAFSEGIFPNYWTDDPSLDIVATGVKGFAHWHVFETESVNAQNGYAALSLPRLDALAGPVVGGASISQPSVSGLIRGYPIKSVYQPLIPADSAEFCDNTSANYIDPTTSPESDSYVAGYFRPANPNLYPWYHTPCTKWVKSGRVTNAAELSPLLSTLSVQFPAPSETSGVFGVAAIAAALTGTFELNDSIGVAALADNTFWYDDEPGASMDGRTVVSLSLSARVSVQTGTVLPTVNYSLPPCPDSNWHSRVAVDVAAVVEDDATSQRWTLCGGVVLSEGLTAALMRGETASVPNVTLTLHKDGWVGFQPGYLDQNVTLTFDSVSVTLV